MTECPHFSLPGVKAISWLLANALSAGTQYQAMAGITVSINYKPTTVTYVGEPELTCEGSNAGNGNEETATLSFQSCEVLPYFENLAFIVTDMDGQTFLIGSEEAPYPLLTRTRVVGTPDGEPHRFTYEVKYTSIHALIPCKTA